MSEKIEGSLVLDGLLQGRLPALPNMEGRLRDWVRTATAAKLPFSLEMDGSSFSVLADNAPLPAAALGPSPSVAIADLLQDLLKIFPPDQRGGVTSTVRSMEYQKGEEVQTLYTVAPDGTVQTRSRSVSAETKAPPRPMTTKEKLRLAGGGLLVAAVIFLISSIFVDYRQLFGRMVDAARPFNADSLTVEMNGTGDYLALDRKAVSDGGKAVVLTLKRGKDFPLQEADYAALLKKAGESLPARLAVEALAAGYVRCEYFDKDGKFLGADMARIADLRSKETVDLLLPLPSDRRLARVVLTY
jgi:hypothetical protein